MGVSASHRKIGAFGGVLYAAGALAHESLTAGADIIHSRQQSRLDVGDLTYLEADRRLDWKTYGLMYDLLEEGFGGTELPELILLDLPLIMGRAVYAQTLDDDETDLELRGEITALRDRADAFWARHLDRCFPFSEKGPRVVSLVRRPFGGLLRLLHAPGQRRVARRDRRRNRGAHQDGLGAVALRRHRAGGGGNPTTGASHGGF